MEVKIPNGTQTETNGSNFILNEHNHNGVGGRWRAKDGEKDEEHYNMYKFGM